MRKQPLRIVRAAILLCVSATAVTSCGGESDTGCSTRDSITVLAASSLRAVLEATRDEFAKSQPCVDVNVSFGSSGALATQVVSGVPADVFLSAGKKATKKVVDAGLGVGEPSEFASNSLAIMVNVTSDFADEVTALGDLTDGRHPGIKVGLCDSNSPCGALADVVLGHAAVAYSNPALTRSGIADTEADSVEGVVTKVKLGELDAGLVYASDCATARQSSDVRCVAIPSEAGGMKVNDSTTYSVLALNDGAATAAYVGFIMGDTFLSILVGEFGFTRI